MGEEGKLLFQVVRYEPKSFSQRRPDDNGGWICNLKGTRLVPYNPPQVMQAKSVIVCEGERDVETLKGMGLTATCNPIGAMSLKNEKRIRDRYIF
jgi:putative DNA primase/helicase